MSIDAPYSFDRRGRTAEAVGADHVRDLVEAVLFTTPGERVNRPTFGCGLISLLFLGNDAALETTTEMTVRAGLQEWLGDVITVDHVSVAVDEAMLTAHIGYIVRDTGERRAEEFVRRR